MPPRKGWAAVYCRLSKEDEEKTARESESIRNQRALLLAWAADHGYRIYRVYTDEDYSGIDRARPGFNAMLADARAGKFEVILAKTQSRFTRDMELVEKYLHGLFPEWGVRFIAVLDHVDTCDPAGKKARQINGLINEWYLEDLSGNVRAVLDHKRRSGSYIASFALYGYRKDPKDHSRLLPDEPAAQVVRQIFALYLQGNGAGRIAQTLNAQGVPPPSAYRAVSAGQPRPTPAPLWCKATVRRILSTQTYAGDVNALLTGARKLVPDLDTRRVVRAFAGGRPVIKGTNDFFIGQSTVVPGLFQAAGIQSPGVASAPAIAEHMEQVMREAGVELRERADWNPIRRAPDDFDRAPLARKEELIESDPAWGRIVCRCETITEGEILDALHEEIPATTIDGVKRRCGAGMGRCQGGFCGPRVLELISKTLGISPLDVLQDKAGTNVLLCETKQEGEHHD